MLREPAEARKQDLGVDTVLVHSLATGGRIGIRGEHLVEPEGIAAAFPPWLAGHRTQPRGSFDDSVVTPLLRAVGKFDHPGSRLLEPGWQSVLPDTRVFDQVIIDRYQSEVVRQHLRTPFLWYRGKGSRATFDLLAGRIRPIVCLSKSTTVP